MGESDDGIDELEGELVFGGGWQGFRTIGENEKDFVLIRIKADAGLGDVVGDDEIAVFESQFFAGVGFQIFGFRREADERAGEADGRLRVRKLRGR